MARDGHTSEITKMKKRYLLTDEQQREVACDIKSRIYDFDFFNPEHQETFSRLMERATAGIYPYRRIGQRSRFAMRRQWEETGGLDYPAMEYGDVAAGVYSVWVFRGELRGCPYVMQYLANAQQCCAYAESTNLIHYLFEKFIKRSIRQKKALRTSVIDAFINHLAKKYATWNNKLPSMHTVYQLGGIYAPSFDGPFCPIEEDGQPTESQTCSTCGSITQAFYIDPERDENFKYRSLYRTYYQESWYDVTRGLLTADADILCQNPICVAVREFTDRSASLKRMAEITKQPMRMPSSKTLESITPEYRPAFLLARYLDFAARVEARQSGLFASALYGEQVC